MRAGRDSRLALLAVLTTVPPLAFVGAGRSPAPAALAVCAIVAVTAGLFRLEASLREVGEAAVSAPTAALVLYGTGLVWYEAVEPGPTAFGFLAACFLATAWWRRPGRSGAEAVALGAGMGVALAALALALEFLGPHRVMVAPGPPPLLDTLFSSRHGVLFWTPLLTLAALGLGWRAMLGRREAAGALAALAALALLNASLRPWWGGGLGNARFVPALPVLAPGLATVLEAIRRAARQRPLRLVAAAGTLLVGWNLLLMAEYRREIVPRDDTVAFPTLVEEGARLVASATGAPIAWPANWLFARRHHVHAARYDLLGGQDVLAAGPARLALGDPTDSAAMLGEGWSVRHRCGPAVCREIEGGRAQLFLPVLDPRAAELDVRAQGPGTLRLSLRGTALGQAALTDTMTEAGFIVRPELLRRGVNEVVLEVSAGGRASVEAVRFMALGSAR